jgi:hypothetical protein
MFPRVQPRIPMGCDTSHWQASQQPPIGPSPYSSWSVPLTDFPPPLGFVRQQDPRAMSASLSPSQGSASAGAWAPGSYSSLSANESYSPYNPGHFVVQRGPPPIIPPLQGPSGVRKSEDLQATKQRRGERFMDSGSTETRSRTSKTERTQEQAGGF